MNFFIGCSGFHYKHWKGGFYPENLPANKWFEFYCKHFRTLELNVTFYRFPTPSMLQQWYDRSADDFVFSVKVPRSITHFKKLNHTSGMIRDFYGLVREGLQQKLGCVLFQFPPSFALTSEHLLRIIDNTDPAFNNVAEFRHPSWWDKDTIEMLGQKQIAFCGMSHPDFPADLIYNTRHLYYRMHGHEKLYTSGYSHAALHALAAKIRTIKSVKDAYIYFNNDAMGFATQNAQYLIKQLCAEDPSANAQQTDRQKR